MSLKRKTAVFIIAAAAVLSCFSFMTYAEEDIAAEDAVLDTEDASSDTEDYITSGDYKYSTQIYDDGSEVAFLEEYIGNDTKIEIPEEIDGYAVKGLGNRTFYLNDKITEIIISENLADFGYYPFYGCTSLMEFKVNENNPIYEADSDGALVGKDGLAIMAYPTGKNPEKYTIADGIVAVNSSAFAMCTNLKEVTFPESIEYLGNFAFSECTSLETIVLPDKLTALGKFEFSGCTALKDVTLPKNLQKIGDAAFYKCESLETIDFPTPLTEIGQAAFCSTGMTSVTIPATISSIGYSAFGFYTDDEDQIIADENFIVMGYNGSYAQTYCTENSITFISLDDEEADITESKEKDKGVPTGVIAGIFVICTVVIIIVFAVIIKRNRDKDEEGGEEDSEENDDTEEE